MSSLEFSSQHDWENKTMGSLAVPCALLEILHKHEPDTSGNHFTELKGPKHARKREKDLLQKEFR